jgi:hypothetical protein
MHKLSKLGVIALLAVGGSTLYAAGPKSAASSKAQQKQPNILVIWGDDIGVSNISYNNRGLMGYRLSLIHI